MKNTNTSNADTIKCRFIDFLINKPTLTCIGNEIMYGIDKKVADLIFLAKGRTYAVEIKSSSDNLKKLDDQIKAYRCVFDYVIIVTTEKHLLNVINSVDTSIGIYIITDDLSVKKIRTQKQQTVLDKLSLLSTINGNYIRKIVGDSDSSTDEIREMLLKKSKLFLKNLLYNYLFERLALQYKLFLSEKGEITHEDDLGSLSNHIFLK